MENTSIELIKHLLSRLHKAKFPTLNFIFLACITSLILKINFFHITISSMYFMKNIKYVFLQLILFYKNFDLIFWLLYISLLCTYLVEKDYIFSDRYYSNGTNTTMSLGNLGKKTFYFIISFSFPIFQMIFIINMFINNHELQNIIYEVPQKTNNPILIFLLFNTLLAIFLFFSYLLSSTIVLDKNKIIKLNDVGSKDNHFVHDIIIDKYLTSDSEDTNNRFQYTIYKQNQLNNPEFTLIKEIQNKSKNEYTVINKTYNFDEIIYQFNSIKQK
ncbi:hypothetical protein IV73_GL001057 [Weissella kandleri]|uniref:Uncharacterized protein n=1 Tax=Weissella kandleri TaxID=1616 RepID=A0A0R2JLK0_9LACO|nr:hypothetical protein [Weissella kandleri]KRN74781.1 hypothetical protein IV73_GL001057 [Weissella kandleri]